MTRAPFHPRLTLATSPLLALLVACGDEDARLIEPVETTVLLDTNGTLEAVAGAADTIDVVIPAGRVLGTIVETNEPIVLRYGPGRYDVIHSGPLAGDAFAAIVTAVGPGPVRMVVRRSMTEVAHVDYRIRVIAVDDSPEHLAAGVSSSGAFRSEWIDPPLDRDVFVLDLEEGEDFFVEFQSRHDDVRMTARVLPPASPGYYLFLEAGPETVRSEVHEALTTGEHRIMIYSAGLTPDVEAQYRFRVLTVD